MSQPESSAPVNFELNYYLHAVETFERLIEQIDSTVKYDYENLLALQEGLSECCSKIDTFLKLEDTNSPHLVAVFQIKVSLQQLIDIVGQKICKYWNTTITSPKYDNKITSTKNIQTTCSSKKEKEVEDIIQNSVEQPRVSGLNEIGGLSEVKKILRTLVVLPRFQPQLFGNRKACNSVLMFGPPGTGKTKIVHALAADSGAVLHSVTAGDLVSPYVGQTEKKLQSLFQHIGTSDQFTMLFIDEIDGLCRRRNASEQEHSRRMKTELMCQMSKIEENKNMLIICATNCPWDLDTAVLRRFQRRIYVPLPNPEERLELLRLLTKDIAVDFSIECLHLFKMKTNGFSGSDIAVLIQHALNIPIMELEDTKIWKVCGDGFYEPAHSGDDVFNDTVVSELSELPHCLVRARPVHMLDFINAADSIIGSVPNQEIEKFENFVGK